MEDQKIVGKCRTDFGGPIERDGNWRTGKFKTTADALQSKTVPVKH